MTSQCAFMLCRDDAVGLVRIIGCFVGVEQRETVEVPMCKADADVIGRALQRREGIHMTPGRAIYIGDLDNALPKRNT